MLTRKEAKIDGVNVVKDYEEVLSMDEEVFIIGGESIYELFLPYANSLYLTEIDASHEADTYFPYFDKELYEREIIKSNSYNGVNYSFVLYKRIK